MKRQILITSAICLLAVTLSAQWSPSVFIGAGPKSQCKSAAVSVPDIHGVDYALRPVTHSSTFAAGLGLRRNYESGFFFAGELQYNTSSTEFRMWQINGGSESNPAMTIEEREHRFSVPLSLGVSLGNVNIHSGVNLNLILTSTNGFATLPDVVDGRSRIYPGWHAGIGYQMGAFEIEARYVQDFRNPAQGLEISGKEMRFYGNRNRLMIVGRYHF